MAVDPEDTESEENPDTIILGNSDTLSERVKQVDLDSLNEKDTCTADEFRDCLDF